MLCNIYSDLCNVPFTILQVSIVSTLLEFMPTLLFFGWAYWLVSQQMRNMPGGGLEGAATR
jgi:hypothetical protein